MKRLFYRLGGFALLSALAISCSPVKEVNPIKEAGARFVAYYQYRNLPEPFIDVTGDPYIRRSANTNYRYPIALGAASVPGGHTMYKFIPSFTPGAPTEGTWQVEPGPNGGGALKMAKALDVYSNGSFTVIAQNSTTGRAEMWSSYRGGAWVNSGIGATDISYGYITPPGGFSTPVLYYLDDTNVFGGHRIYMIKNGIPVEIVSGAAAVSIAGDRAGRLWVVNSLGQIFLNSDPSNGAPFTQVQGAATDITAAGNNVGLLGDLFLRHGYEIFTRDASVPATQWLWDIQPGDATQIGSNAVGDCFLVNDLGELFLAPEF